MTDLERRLQDLAGVLDVPRRDVASIVIEQIIADDQPALADSVMRILVRRQRRRRLLLALVAAIAVAAPVTAAVVRHWTIGGTTITRTGTLPAAASPTLAIFGQPTTIDDAQRTVAFPILRPARSALPDPVEVRAAASPPGGRVTLLYPASATLPALGVPSIGAALTELRATVGPGFFDKMITPGTKLTTFEIDGRPAIWLSGEPHVVIFHTSDGIDQVETVQPAANVLLWQRGSLLLRLESRLELAGALRIARSVG